MGARHVDLFGADCRGTTDVSGYEGEDRTLERWRREELDLAATFQLLADHGTTVNRVPP